MHSGLIDPEHVLPCTIKQDQALNTIVRYYVVSCYIKLNVPSLKNYSHSSSPIPGISFQFLQDEVWPWLYLLLLGMAGNTSGYNREVVQKKK